MIDFDPDPDFVAVAAVAGHAFVAHGALQNCNAHHYYYLHSMVVCLSVAVVAGFVVVVDLQDTD